MRVLKAAKILFAIVLAALFFSSCASFAQQTAQHRRSMERGAYDAALAELEANPVINNNKNRVLFLLDKATALHLAGRAEESNKYFELAERQADAYWATSITEEAASLVTSDDIMAYPGEDFERAMIPIYRAMNYLILNDLEAALVECRRVDIKLNEINSRYKTANVYREDAFARWMTGIIYEAAGDINNALVAYRRAIAVYEKDYAPNYRLKTPKRLIEDYLRALKEMDFQDELSQAAAKYPFALSRAVPLEADMGEIVLIHQNGRSPHKTEGFVVVPIDNTVVKVAFPLYNPTPYRVSGAIVRAGEAKAVTEKAQNITEIAIKNLKDRSGRWVTKTAARAALKFGAKKLADKANPLLGLAVNVANVATEKADTRSWLTLPAEFNIARLPLKAGVYTVSLQYLGGGMESIYGETLPDVKVEAGKKLFIIRRTWH